MRHNWTTIYTCIANDRQFINNDLLWRDKSWCTRSTVPPSIPPTASSASFHPPGVRAVPFPVLEPGCCSMSSYSVLWTSARLSSWTRPLVSTTGPPNWLALRLLSVIRFVYPSKSSFLVDHANPWVRVKGASTVSPSGWFRFAVAMFLQSGGVMGACMHVPVDQAKCQFLEYRPLNFSILWRYEYVDMSPEIRHTTSHFFFAPHFHSIRWCMVSLECSTSNMLAGRPPTPTVLSTRFFALPHPVDVSPAVLGCADINPHWLIIHLCYVEVIYSFFISLPIRC